MILVDVIPLYSIMFSAEMPGYFWAIEYSVSPFFTVYFVYSAEEDAEDEDAVAVAEEDVVADVVLEDALGAEPLL